MAEAAPVFEVHGGDTAAGGGFDFTVCRDLSELLRVLGNDLVYLEEGAELRVIRKAYTAEQLAEVCFE